MKPRIERIKVKRGGPLEKDFEIQPGDLNLIYGLNETGKTYLLESLVRLLFKTQGRDAPGWNLREWDTNGKILVSGIEGEGQVTSFSKTSKKLEDYRCGEDDHLPREFSRLLVVRAGETVISADPGEDGISRDILKDYLSEERLLDELLERISATVQGAQVTEKVIVGDNRGELKKQKGLKKELDALNKLLEEVKDNFSEGPVSILRKDRAARQELCEDLERAKRHQAYLLRSELKQLEEERSALEGLEVLGEMESSIDQHDGKVSDGVLLEKEVKELQEAVGKRQWCEEALKNYEDIINRRSVKGPEKAWGIGAAAALIVSVAGGLLDQNLLLGAGAALSLVCGWMFFRKLSGAAPMATSDNVELGRMEQQYQEYFGKALGDRASLARQLGSLQEDLVMAKAKQGQLDQSNSAAAKLRSRLDGFFLQAGFENLDSGDWRKTLAELRSSHKTSEDKISACQEQLRNLLVPQEDDLEADPGTAWDPGQFKELTAELEQLETKIELEEGSLDDLKERVAAQTGLRLATGWDVLLDSLQEQKESKLGEYTECTADILAKIKLCGVLEDMRQKETERIEQGLKKDDLTTPLSSLTGKRYQSIHLDGEGGLQLGDGEGSYYALRKLSTGVREQICLALRFGFASIALGGPAFLLLDDAFQHSDWERRPRMIKYVVELARQGWQVFYFTMDNHIRDQFCEAGQELGSSFKYEALE